MEELKQRPVDLEIEQAVLGALIIEKESILKVADILKPVVFDKDAHKLIYSVIEKLFINNSPIDLIIVTNKLRDSGNLEKAGGAYYITSLTNKVNSGANIEYHSRLLLEYYMKREIINISDKVIKKAYSPVSDCFELKDFILSNVNDIDVTKNKINQNIYDSFPDFYDQLHKENTAISTGFIKLDRAFLGGWQKGDNYVIGAATGMGKTMNAIQWALNAASQGWKPLIFTLEMSEFQFKKRMLQNLCTLEAYQLTAKYLNQSPNTSELITKVWGQNEWLNNITIVDSAMITEQDIYSLTRKYQYKQGVDMVILDYLQLVTGSGTNNIREQEIAKISRNSKKTAKAFNVAFLNLVQISKEVEKRESKRPMLSDTRESSSINNDADAVIFLVRPAYYEMLDETGFPVTHMEFIIAKNRHDFTGTILVDNDPRYMRVFDFK
jgi:replicative DNA helicase